MNPELVRSLENFLEPGKLAGGSIVGSQRISGGCINQAAAISLRNGGRFFVKWNDHAPEQMFDVEAASLRVLRSTETVRVPEVVGSGHSNGTDFLVLELIEPGQRTTNFSRDLGTKLAKLHRWNIGRRDFGFDHDNFLGLSIQPNAISSSWPEFWAEHRLGHQLRMASANGWDGTELVAGGERLRSRIDKLIAGPDEPPSLVHGDLWSGNYMVGSNGEPILIDPACYFGQREAEFGMISLFGGFDSDFYSAYNEVWPLADGANERIELYRLYHLLNHLNLFGASYLDDCLRIIRKYM